MQKLNFLSSALEGSVIQNTAFRMLLLTMAIINVFVLSSTVYAEEQPTTHEVQIVKFKFVPAKLTIKAGDRVVWINKDIAPHTATATDNNNQWDTGRLKKNESGSITFTATGLMQYLCTYHPSMRGEITVVP